MPESADWLPVLLQLQDSSFPTGGYAHSFGLEELAQLGLVRDESTLATYLRRNVVPALIHLELPFVAEVHRTLREGRRPSSGVRELAPTLDSRSDAPFATSATPGNGDFQIAGPASHPMDRKPSVPISALITLDHHYAALRPARESRAASAQIGTRRLATWLKVRPGDPLLQSLQGAIEAGRLEGHHAIIFPAILREAPLDIVLTAYAHQTLAGLCTAALKLIRIGQEGSQRALAIALADLAPRLPEAAATPVEAAGWFDPLTEIASQRHETAFSRLFIS